MGILRSETMKHGTLVLPADRGRQFINVIGEKMRMQFEDMNAQTMHRPYKKYIQRIDEMERILRFLMDELTRVPDLPPVIKNNVDEFLEHASDYKLDDVEAHLKTLHKDFHQFKDNTAKLVGRRNSALEERCVVQIAMASMAQVSAHSMRRHEDLEQFEYAATRSLLEDEEGGRRTLDMMFSNIAGVIPQAEQDRFARAVFRATRGNTFTHFQQIFEPMQDPTTGQEAKKSVFVIYFQDRGGSNQSAMSDRITKICNSFGVNTYRWPTSRHAADERKLILQVQVEEQDRLLNAHRNFIREQADRLLESPRLGADSLIEEWRLFCAKEKAIYATLNLFEEGNMNLRANCWYPEAEENEIRSLLIRQSPALHGHSNAMLVDDRTPPKKTPPTYCRRNEFTAIFQDLIFTYGLPRYGEVNAALFTIVTFPFLFGVMYGDIGHGSMLLLVGIFALWKADELKYKVPQLYDARYIIFMMGLFAVYAGLLYNDIFAIGLDLFGSRWVAPASMATDPAGTVVTYEPLYDVQNSGGKGPYPFGVDPAWHGAQNELVYMNSLKMKMSVIIGVTHMIVGLCLRFVNAFHERNMLDFLCECVPMMVFMLCFFGFMDYMILHKWVNSMESPPNIINSMISMAMWTPDSNPMFGASLPRMLMLISILTVPAMLIPKPLILRMQHQAKQRARVQRRGFRPQGREIGSHVQMTELDSDDERLPLSPSHTATAARARAPVFQGDLEEPPCVFYEEEEDSFEFGDILIHQVIETIEYVLGTVSHTASYLRLWALSLAHQQLSKVFFEYCILTALNMPLGINMIAVFCMFSIWFGATVGILLGMDVLECFLHTLRLHWVEFQAKFYRADGYPFVPYRHKDILEGKHED